MYRIDVRRVLLRPEGIEIVLVDPESPQLAIMPQVVRALRARGGQPPIPIACGSGRLPPSHTSPTPVTVPAVYAPVLP